MKDYLDRIFMGRQGMDQLSKTLFWFGLGFAAVSFLVRGLAFLPNFLFLWGLFLLIFAFARAFSRKLQMREMENNLYLVFLNKQKQKRADRKYRREASKEYCFFRCPGCNTWLRVPRGKGKIHIRCKCGYTLYRKT